MVAMSWGYLNSGGKRRVGLAVGETDKWVKKHDVLGGRRWLRRRRRW